MNQEEFDNLKGGDIIRHLPSSIAYIVTSNYGDRVTAVRTVDVRNPGDWFLAAKADYEIKGPEE